MDSAPQTYLPKAVTTIRDRASAIGFDMGSDLQTGQMLRFLAGTKPGGRILELGTGTGLSAAWMLDGMDRDARLLSLDIDPNHQSIAIEFLGNDDRVEFRLMDSAEFIEAGHAESYDLIFADSWPGKFSHLEDTLLMLKRGGIYFVDDMQHATDWHKQHRQNFDHLIQTIESKPDLVTLRLDWSTGLLMATRR